MECLRTHEFQRQRTQTWWEHVKARSMIGQWPSEQLQLVIQVFHTMRQQTYCMSERSRANHENTYLLEKAAYEKETCPDSPLWLSFRLEMRLFVC